MPYFKFGNDDCKIYVQSNWLGRSYSIEKINPHSTEELLYFL